MRLHRLLLAALLSLSCDDKKPTAIVVLISSEPKIPTEIAHMEVRVMRGNQEKFVRLYDLRAGERLPGTLTLSKEEGSGDEPVTVRVRASTGPGKPWREVREAHLGFVAEKSKLLRMPLRYSCLDFKGTCAGGQTCIGGACRTEEVNAEALPEFESNTKEIVQIPAKAAEAPAGECFLTEACFSAALEEPFNHDDCSFHAPGADGGFNVAMRWKETPGHLALLEPDPIEGYVLKNGRVVLSEGLCAALADGRALSIVASSQCPTKSAAQPLCVIQAEAPAAPSCEPVPETCNGVDDDCDGLVDNDLSDSASLCDAQGAGRCQGGRTACQGGIPQCVPLEPVAEECNGIDDNCDGLVDETCTCAPGETIACYTGPDGTADVGQCRSGTQPCEGGTPGPCTGSVEPKPESCNGLDDNCDGLIDEGCGEAGAGGEGQGGAGGDGAGGDGAAGDGAGGDGAAGDGAGGEGAGGSGGAGGEGQAGSSQGYDCQATPDCASDCSRLGALCAEQACAEAAVCANPAGCEGECSGSPGGVHACLANAAVVDCASLLACVGQCP